MFTSVIISQYIRISSFKIIFCCVFKQNIYSSYNYKFDSHTVYAREDTLRMRFLGPLSFCLLKCVLFLIVGVTAVNIHLKHSTSIEPHKKYERQHLQLSIDHSDIYFAHPLNVLPLSQHLRKITPINGAHIRLADGHK